MAWGRFDRAGHLLPQWAISSNSDFPPMSSSSRCFSFATELLQREKESILVSHMAKSSYTLGAGFEPSRPRPPLSSGAELRPDIAILWLGAGSTRQVTCSHNRLCPPTLFFRKRTMAEDNILEEDNVQPFFPRGGQCPTVGRPKNCPQIVLLHIFKRRETGEAKITRISQCPRFINPQRARTFFIRETN